MIIGVLSVPVIFPGRSIKLSSTGFGNVTIPKSAVAYRTTPTIYSDNQPASSQGYIQDDNNYYYVWYTIHFSTHHLSIVFAVGSSIPEFSSATMVSIIVAMVAVTLSAVALTIRPRKKL